MNDIGNVDLSIDAIKLTMDRLMEINIERSRTKERTLKKNVGGNGYDMVETTVAYPVSKRFDVPVVLFPPKGLNEERLLGYTMVNPMAMFALMDIQLALWKPDGEVHLYHTHYLPKDAVKQLVPRRYYDIHGSPRKNVEIFEHHETVIFPDGRETYSGRWLTWNNKMRRLGMLIGEQCHRRLFDLDYYLGQANIRGSSIEDCFCQPHMRYCVDGMGSAIYSGLDEATFAEINALRDNPVTATGRKRPIRHAVAKHFRRNGALRIPVTAHIKGIEQFRLGDEIVHVGMPVSAYSEMDDDYFEDKYGDLSDPINFAPILDKLRRMYQKAKSEALGPAVKVSP